MGNRQQRRRKKPQPVSAKLPGPAAPSKHIFLACPSGSGAPDHTTTLTINRMLVEASEHGWVVNVAFRTHDSMITRARDVLASQFLESKCTDLFFLDDDIGARPGSFCRLMNHPVDMVGGAYRGRMEKEEYVLRPLPGGSIQADPKTLLMEVEAVGTGFLRITRDAMERVAAIDPDAWYYDHTAPKDLKVRSLFDNHLDRKTRQKWSEDYSFCKLYRDTGGKVWVDPTLELDHTGKQLFRGRLIDYLQKNCQMPQPAASVARPSTLQLSKMFLEAATA